MERDRPSENDLKRIREQAAEGLHERLDDPDAPLETGPVERGRVDAGPTGEREGGYREAESSTRILWIGGAAVIVVLGVLVVAWLR